jgi:hypothetical protein
MSVPRNEIVQSSYKQKTFFPPIKDGKDYHHNARNIATCVSLTQEIEQLAIAHDGDDSPYEYCVDILNAMHRSEFAGKATRKQYLNGFQSSAYLYFTTQGHAGFSPCHLQESDATIKTFLAKCSQEKQDWLIAHMCNHPDGTRAEQWQEYRQDLESARETQQALDAKDAKIAKLESDMDAKVAKLVAKELAKLQKPTDDKPQTAIGQAMTKANVK